MARNTTSTRSGSGYILTITADGPLETRLKVESSGRMTDLSGAPITGMDVTIAVLHFRNQGKRDIARNIQDWWDHR